MDLTSGSLAAVASYSAVNVAPSGSVSANSRNLTNAIGQKVPVRSRSMCGGACGIADKFILLAEVMCKDMDK